jgi:hypothetical protein
VVCVVVVVVGGMGWMLVDSVVVLVVRDASWWSAQELSPRARPAMVNTVRIVFM